MLAVQKFHSESSCIAQTMAAQLNCFFSRVCGQPGQPAAKTIQCQQACGACSAHPMKGIAFKSQISQGLSCPSLVPHGKSKQQKHFVKIWNSESNEQWNQTWKTAAQFTVRQSTLDSSQGVGSGQDFAHERSVEIALQRAIPLITQKFGA